MNSTADLIGALPPPPGVTPNFVNPPTIGHRIIIVGIIFPVLTIPFLVARLYAKYFLMKKLHLDDYLIMLGVPFTLAFSILQMYQTKNGSGYHMWDITSTKFQKYFFICGTFGPLLYGIGKLFIKSSILTLYLRLTSERRVKMVTYIVLFAVCAYSLFAAFSFLFMCRPMESYWNLSTPGKCLDSKAFSLIISVLNVVTDMVMLFLPVWILKSLRLPRKQKIGVTLILMTGSFVCIVSIITLAGIPHVMQDPDFTWVAIEGLVWCTVEMYTAIICACLPSLKIIVKHYYPSFFEFEQNLHLSTMTAFPIDDLQFSGQQFANPFDQSASENGKASSSVRLHAMDSNPTSTAEDQIQNSSSATSLDARSLEPPQKAFLVNGKRVNEAP